MNRGGTYSYILMDLDGTLLDGKEKHYQCYKDIMKQAGCIPMDIEQYWKRKRERVSLDTLLGGGMEKETFLLQWQMRIETEKYLRYDKLKPQILWALEKIKDKTFHLWLVTNRRNGETLEWQLKVLGLREYFERIFYTGERQGGDKAACLPNIDYGNAILIGDTEMDQKTAEKIGIEFIPIYNGLREKGFFEDSAEGAEEVFQIKWLWEERADGH